MQGLLTSTNLLSGNTLKRALWRALAALLLAWAFVALPGGASQAAGASSNGDAQKAEAGPDTRRENKGNLNGHGGPVRALKVDADGREALTGSFDYSMIHWDISGEEPKIIHRYTEHDAAVNTVQFLPGNRALSAGDDAIVRLWDLKTHKLIHAFKGHTAKIADLAVSDDARMAASASWDRSVRLWNLETLQPGPVLEGHMGPVNAVAFGSKDKKALYSAGYDGTVRHWELPSGEFKRALYRHGWGLNCLVRLPDSSKLLYGSLNGTAGVLDVESGEPFKVLIPHEGPVLALAVDAKHKLIATGGGDGGVNVWSLEDWGLKEQHQNPYGPIWGLAFIDEGKKLYYSGLDDFVTIWQVRPRQPFETVESRFPRRFQATKNMSLGELQFARKCSVCHTLKPDDGNRAGPTLYGVFGRRAGSVAGYAYSPALRSSDIVWNEDTIGQLFDHGPQHVTPGSKMPLQQIADAKKRDALIAFLKRATAPKGDGQAAGQGGPGKSRE